MHDVVIAGGSLAGAATAIHLAERGRSVLLLDRQQFPRPKACGEGLFPAGVAELERLGVLASVQEASSPLRKVRFHAGASTVEAPLGTAGGGLGLSRTHLDAAVLDRAREAGVEIRLGVTATGLRVSEGNVVALRTSEGDLPGRAFVAADGLHSRLRRIAGLDTGGRGDRYGVNGHLRVGGEWGRAVDVYFEPGHEIYVTPVGAACLNVAILTRRAGMRRFAGNIDGAFEALLREHPAFRDGFELCGGPLAAGPFPAGCSRAWKANLVLAGDAAGFFDGISGEGMTAALLSARECAAAIDAYLTGGSYEPFRRYDRRRRALVRNSNLLARVSLALSRQPRVAELAVRNLSRRPETFARLVAINTGEAGLGSIRPRDVLALALGL